jgi:serine acetyltransferase
LYLQGELSLNEQILQACKELVDDAKQGCADLVFKEVCLEILSRASHVLTERQFKQLATYTSERMKEKMSLELQQELAMNK